MNFMIWLVAGGAMGWLGFSVLHANENRGMMASVIIGCVGGVLGGYQLAPVFGAVTDASNAFSPFSLVVALAVAGIFLTIGNLLSDRYGI